MEDKRESEKRRWRKNKREKGRMAKKIGAETLKILDPRIGGNRWNKSYLDGVMFGEKGNSWCRVWCGEECSFFSFPKTKPNLLQERVIFCCGRIHSKSLGPHLTWLHSLLHHHSCVSINHSQYFTKYGKMN